MKASAIVGLLFAATFASADGFSSIARTAGYGRPIPAGVSETQTILGNFEGGGAFVLVGTRATPLDLPAPPGWSNFTLTGISGDRTTYIGVATSPAGNRLPFSYNGAFHPLPVFDKKQAGDAGTASAISYRAQVVAGSGKSSNGEVQGAKWGLITLAPPLGPFNGFTDSSAFAISGDGDTILGRGHDANGHFQYYRWQNYATGIVPLGTFTGGDYVDYGNVGAVSYDGSVIVGALQNASHFPEAFRWTAGGGLVGLGHLDATNQSSYATGVAADGSVIIGNTGDSTGGTQAFLWTLQGGMVSLKDRLVNNGALSTGWSLKTADFITPDGTFILGQATDPQGDPQSYFAWISSNVMFAKEDGMGMFVNSGSSVDVFHNDFNSDGATLQIVGHPAHGAASLWGGTIPGGIIYTPNQDYVGPDAVLYRFSKDGRWSNISRVVVRVVPEFRGVTTVQPQVIGGHQLNASITVYPHGLGGTDPYIATSSDTAAARVSVHQYVPVGSSTGTFPIFTSGVDNPTDVTLTVTYPLGKQVLKTTFTVIPSSLVNLTSPLSTKGGNKVIFKIWLDGYAGPAGAPVDLASSRPDLISVGTPQTVSSGASFKLVTVNTHAVSTSTPVTLTATYRGRAVSSTITLTK